MEILPNILASRLSGARKRRRRTEAGFTLIELLVVIAILAILAGLLLPALVAVKAKGQAVICLNQERQLMLSCLLYGSDHDDSFPPNLGAAETKQTVSEGKFLNWVNNVMSWELEEDNTNTTWVRAYGLGPYLSGDVQSFKCPSDTVLSDLQRGAGWTARVRSMSMNAMVGDAGEFTRTGFNKNNPHYEQFFKIAQVPEPSEIFVFIEEHPDSIDDGYFLNKYYSGEWHDLPASYHDGGANLAYADGHVARHEWLHASTKPKSRPDVARLPFSVPDDEYADFKWLMSRTSVKKKY